MAHTLRQLRPLAAVAPLALLWGLPLAFAMLSMVLSLTSGGASAFLAIPAVAEQAVLSVMIGAASTLVAAVVSLWLAVSAPHKSNGSLLGWYLAVPHLAFAVGLSFLIMPTGPIARLIYEVPPQWVTVQDPHGIGLAAALALKEIPFLLWLMHAALNRPDFARSLEAQKRVARSLGHGSRSIPWRIVVPQLMKQISWPLVIVWVYGCSVVDMAIVIGPTQPAPLQISIWHDLNDADAANNGRGLAGVALLTLLLTIVLAASAAVWRASRPWLRAYLILGPHPQNRHSLAPRLARSALALIYAAVVSILILLSFTQRWPFPQLWPEVFSASAWLGLIAHPQPILTSLAFALATSLSGLLLCLLWFECSPVRWDKLLSLAALLALAIPAIALAAGQYWFFLRVHLNGTATGVYVAQLAPVFAYMFLTLKGPYRSFDDRYRSMCHGLNCGEARFLFRVKWPLLIRPLASAAAIGFAVSMAQYVSVQLVGAGNFPTLTTEAVTLASGGNRAILAAYALCLTLLTASVFALASLPKVRRGA